MGFPLIRFEDAVITLDPFTRVHPYETKDFIMNDVLKHFQEVSVLGTGYREGGMSSFPQSLCSGSAWEDLPYGEATAEPSDSLVPASVAPPCSKAAESVKWGLPSGRVVKSTAHRPLG